MIKLVYDCWFIMACTSNLVQWYILFIGIASSDALTSCPVGWVGYLESCYKIIEESLSLSDAVGACQRLDTSSYLAVSNNAVENSFLDELTPGRIWLGCDAQDGGRVWRCRDGSGNTFNAATRIADPLDSYWNWDSSQPENNDHEQCLVLYQGGQSVWHSFPCTFTFQAVCERDTDRSTDDFVSSYDFVFTYLQPKHDEMSGSFAYMLITTTSNTPGQVSINLPWLQRFERHMLSYTAPANITLPTSVYLTEPAGKQNKSIIIKSEVPISVQAMYIYQYFRSTGFSVLPTSLLGKEYFVASYDPHDSEKSEFSVTALAEQTNVRIDMTRIGGTILKFTLEPYESYQYQSTSDLTGASIRASSPVSVMSGATGVRVGVDVGGPEYFIQNVIPVENLGTRYLLAPFVGRTSGFVYRVIATEEQTILSIPKNVILESAGQFYEGVNEEILFISSNKPIMVILFAKSHHSDTTGDSLMLIVSPIQDARVGEISFPVTNMATKSIQRSYISVTVACQNVGLLVMDDNVNTNWESRDEIPLDGTSYCLLSQLVTPGVHRISTNGFGVPYNVLVYGFGDKYVGYAFSLWPFLQPRINRNQESFSKDSYITCDSQMVVYLNSSVIEPGHYQEVHLNDPSCTGEMYDNKTIRIATDFNACGTEMIITDDNLIFRNKLVYRTSRNSTVPGIATAHGNNTQYYDLNTNLTCTVPRRGNSSLGEFIGPINSNDAGFGHLMFSLDMYKDANFADTYNSNDFPVMIDEGQSIFLAASTVRITDVRLSVESCRVTPSRNADDAIKHTIMENGCGTENTITFYDSTNIAQQRFSMSMYSFFENQPKMFIHCDMFVCAFNDSTSCPPLSNDCPPRVQRAINTGHVTSMTRQRVTVSTDGPFQIQPAKYSHNIQDATKTGTILAAVGGVSLCVAVAIVMVLAFKRIRYNSSYSTLDEVEMNDFTT